MIDMIETENVPGVSYAKIARAAVMEGKPDLAIRLLDCEAKYSEQVCLMSLFALCRCRTALSS